MKRCLSVLLALLLLLPGCGKKQEQSTIQPCEVLVRAMRAYTPECLEEDSLFHWYLYDGMRDAGFGEDSDYYSTAELNELLSGFYGLEGLDWYDAAIVRMGGARAFELAVLSVPEEERDTVVDAWQEYLLNRQGAFTGYEPEQAALVENGKILTLGQEVALLICESVPDAQDAFENCYGEGRFAAEVPEFLLPEPKQLPNGRYIYVDPDIDDMTVFDNSAILDAWKDGDDSGLSKTDKKILNAAKAVVEERITPEMSDYDKELALYAWLTEHVSYDHAHYEFWGASRTSYEPYGPLIKGKGVCLGYATTFQLLMDMVGVECITVVGAAFHNREDHAWNMVRLNGNWYCADPTWDKGRSVTSFIYFNVTSDWMAATDHQWDYDSVPEATAEDYGRE